MFFKGKFELSPYGEEFSKSYIVLKLLDKNQIIKFNKDLIKVSQSIDKSASAEESLGSSEKIIEMMYKVVTDQFVEGLIFDGTEERPMKKDDISSFPPAIIKELNQFVQGSLEKKV